MDGRVGGWMVLVILGISYLANICSTFFMYIQLFLLMSLVFIINLILPYLAVIKKMLRFV